jgi:hypothetical protein
MVCNDEPRVSRSKPNIISITDVWSLNFTTQVIVVLVPSTVIVCTEFSYWSKSYFKQDYLAPMLKLSVQICYGCHHILFDRYEISISQMPMGLLLLSHVFFSFLYHRQYFYWTWLYIWATRWVSYKKQELLPHREHLEFVLVVSVLVIVFVFCVALCFVCLRLVSCLHNVQSFWIAHSWLPLRFSLTFI